MSLRSIFASARSALAGLFRPAPKLALSYDAARAGGAMEAHWVHADGLSADAANSREVRHTLIKRSRYEFESNGFFCGAIQTHVAAIVGAGPILRMQTGDKAVNQRIEIDWYEWAEAVQLRRRLLTAVTAWKRDGEVFFVLFDNPTGDREIDLDFTLLEAEQCQSSSPTAGGVDGIVLDKRGNIRAYEFLREHPGGSSIAMLPSRFVSAEFVLHLFTAMRPGQHRGVPACSSSLNVGASSRRFREATVRAAETAATISSVLYTDRSAVDAPPAEGFTPFVSIPAQIGSMMTLPDGLRQDSFKTDQPRTGYAEFCKQQLTEAVRPLGLGYALASADAESANFSSLKAAGIWHGLQLGVDRAEIAELVLSKLFAVWWRSRYPGETPTHSWQWPVQPSADRGADAAAIKSNIESGVLTLTRACADAGLDYEDELNQHARDYGISPEEMRKVLLLTHFPAATAVLPPAAPSPGVISGDEDAVLEGRPGYAP